MDLDHDTVVWFSKTYGMCYLLAFSIAVVVYAYWPSNRKRFDHAAESILDNEDRPWR